MRLVRWRQRDLVRVGRVVGDHVVPVDGTVLDLARRATAEPGWTAPAAGAALSLEGAPLLAPVERPPSVRDFSSFERHVAAARRSRGLGMEPGWYERPVFYFSHPGNLVGPDAEVPVPPRTAALDFELELAWLVGSDVRGAHLAEAGAAIVGFTVMNDWSARDVQREEMRHSLGPAKGKDFATSLGPVLVTADELDPGHGAMRAWVNGRLYGEADLSESRWSPREMTAYAAEGSVVCAGDVLASGACGSGCILELALGSGEEAYPWLRPGDVVELEIEPIGRLRNTVGARSASPAWAPDQGRHRPPAVGAGP